MKTTQEDWGRGEEKAIWRAVLPLICDSNTSNCTSRLLMGGLNKQHCIKFKIFVLLSLVSLTKTTKKGLEVKQNLIEEVSDIPRTDGHQTYIHLD